MTENQRPDFSNTVRALEQLVEHRRRLIGDKVRVTNRLTSILKNLFPQVLQWFTDKDNPTFCDFLAQRPTLESVQWTRPATLKRLFQHHHVRYEHLIEQRIAQMKTALPLTEDLGVIMLHALMVEALVQQLRATLHAIRLFDSRIPERSRKHEDFELFSSLPGAGPAYAARAAHRLRGTTRAIPSGRRSTTIRRDRPRHRA